MPAESDLQKLRIDKADRAQRGSSSALPWIVTIVVIVISLVVGLWFWKGQSSGLIVETIRVRVAEGAMTERDMVSLNATGYVTAAAKIELASKVIGRVAWVGVEMADKIEKGQELVRLEDDEFRARVAQERGQLEAARARLAELVAGSRPQEIAQAQAAVDRARAELANSERNLERLKVMQSDAAVTTQEVDDASTQVLSRQAEVQTRVSALELAKLGPRSEQIDAQRAVVRQLEGSLALAEIDLGNTVIRSTIKGTVLERNVEVGEFVTTGFVGDRGAKGYVVSIADLNDLRVELDISQNDFAKVQPGQPCRIVTDAYPDRPYDGVVDLIAPEANRQKATVLVKVRVLNPDALLKPDMNASVSFLSTKALASTRAAASQPGTSESVSSQPAAAILIPSSAIQDGAVYVVEQGVARRRPVTVGATSVTGDVEINRGLIGGEDLIVNIPAGLTDGAKVQINTKP